MLSGEKILVTGASGLVGLQVARFLAAENEVWGLARFANAEQRAGAMNSTAGSRDDVDNAGIRSVPCDLDSGDFSQVPDDFTYVLHLAHTRRGLNDFVGAVQVNAVGAGHLLHHCRKAKGALVVSSTAVYSPPADVFQPAKEDGDIGRAFAPWAPTSPVSKVSLEAVARFCAEAFNLPVALMRLNTVYGPMGGLPIMDMDTVAGGGVVNTFADPYPHTPIHIDDMCHQLEALLEAASTPANIINWCGDDVVTQRQWCEYAGTLSGQPVNLAVHPIPGAPDGNVSDNQKRLSLTGPARHRFKEAFEAIYRERRGG